MKMNSKLLQSTLVSAFALASTAGSAQGMGAGKDKEKCFGIAKTGENDCGNGKHGCGGNKDFKDYDMKEWKKVKKGTCKAEQKKVKDMQMKAKAAKKTK